VTRTVYLASFDRHDDILAYDTVNGVGRVLARQDFEGLGVLRTFGAFTRDGEHLFGVFASPEGPVFFLDAQQLVGAHGTVSATISPPPAHGAPGGKHRLTLSVAGGASLSFDYREHAGIGTNPYDTTPEDVDLAAMIAAGIEKKQFFAGYTKNWV
jgi:hypothetical protein